MQAFIEYVVKSVVDHPDDVKIEQAERGGATVYRLKLHPDDVGKIIGKDGVMINAMRSLVQAASAKKGQRALIEVLNDQPS
jgi:predicted RNA-binding protein YlqC (UPF0109 family)